MGSLLSFELSRCVPARAEVRLIYQPEKRAGDESRDIYM
jgi:hypothetical protein